VAVGGMGESVGIAVGAWVAEGGMGVSNGVDGAWLFVAGGIVMISAGLAQAARIEDKNKIQNIMRNVLRITIPPFDLGISQIIYLNRSYLAFKKSKTALFHSSGLSKTAK
jgi:hypothetical protein